MAAAEVLQSAMGQLAVVDPKPSINPEKAGAEQADDEADDSENEGGNLDAAAGDAAAGDAAAGGTAAAAKKKRKRRKTKKRAKEKAKQSIVQSVPPRVLVCELFPDRSYPPGEEVEYRDENRYRTTSEEKRHDDKLKHDFLTDYREAAEVHRQVRQWARTAIQPGMPLLDVANGIEDAVRALTGHTGLEEGDGLVAGMGFPTGLSINHCAAHYTPNAGNKMVLQSGDVLKVDIGVHVRGRIVDSAFTLAWEPRFDPLLLAVREATNAGVHEAGIDARVGEIGAVIQEVMESHEVDVGAGPVPVRAIRNLTGHNILPFSIHGTKAVPIVRSSDSTLMEEGDVFAIETFGTTGNGYVQNDGEVSHYARRAVVPNVSLPISSAKSLLAVINKQFGTLPFCRRYLDRLGQDRYLLGLNKLVSAGVVESYPPLCDIKGSYTAQFEHTLILRPTVKEVISRGEDY